MARIRSIKPEFWTSEQVMACSTNARLLFIGLWNFCDDAGRHPVSPRQIKALIFPSDDISAENVLGMIDELSSNGLLDIYVVENKEYLQVTGWQHQKIDKPQKAKYPEPLPEHSSNGIDGTHNTEGNTDKDSSEPSGSGAEAPVDFEKLAFERGKEVLGKSAGGVIAKLRRDRCKSWEDTVSVIETAATKQSPMEWVQAVLRKPPEDDVLRGVDYAPLTPEERAYALANGLS